MSRHSRHIAEIPTNHWRPGQVYALAFLTLILGIAAGYLFRGSSAAASSPATSNSAATGSDSGSVQSSSLTPASPVEPLLQRLKDTPNDPELLANIGNQYYDNRDYGKAIEYYERSLKLRPENVNVRTDMGTAIWYSGDPDRAIREYETSLKYQPNHAQTLFNMGVVKSQGKQDPSGAILVWEKLLATNPTYADKDKVEQMLQRAKGELIAKYQPIGR